MLLYLFSILSFLFFLLSFFLLFYFFIFFDWFIISVLKGWISSIIHF